MGKTTFFRGATAGAGFALAALSVSATYAAMTYLVSVGTASTGGQVSSTEWNKMVANFTTIDSKLGATVPTGGVMAFVGTVCPTGWSPADGTANGVKMTDGTPTTLDLRGEFIRGLDAAGVGSRGTDPGRTLASWQKGSLNAVNTGGDYYVPIALTMNASSTNDTDHDNTRSVMGLDAGILTQYDSGNSYAAWTNSTYVSGSVPARGNMKNGDGTKDFTMGSTRPRNVALLYCVKN